MAIVNQLNQKVTKIAKWVENQKNDESTKSQTASDDRKSSRKTKILRAKQ